MKYPCGCSTGPMQDIVRCKDHPVPPKPDLTARSQKRNTIFTIYPYLHNGVLVFDDTERGLDKEAFVANSDNVILALAIEAGYEDSIKCKYPFPLHFSDNYFPGAQEAHKLDTACASGSWYKVYSEECWLCNAALKYFDKHPDTIYFQVPPRLVS